MAGGQSGDGDGAYCDMAGPVQRCAAGLRDAEALENGVDAERGDEAGGLKPRHCGQGADGCCAKMIVVVVGDDYCIDGRQVGEGKGRREETFRASKLRWGRALLPDRVDEYANAIDFNERGRVAHPGDSETGARAVGKDLRVCVERTGGMLWRSGGGPDNEARTDFEHDGEPTHLGWYRVHKLIT